MFVVFIYLWIIDFIQSVSYAVLINWLYYFHKINLGHLWLCGECNEGPGHIDTPDN